MSLPDYTVCRLWLDLRSPDGVVVTSYFHHIPDADRLAKALQAQGWEWARGRIGSDRALVTSGGDFIGNPEFRKP